LAVRRQIKVVLVDTRTQLGREVGSGRELMKIMMRLISPTVASNSPGRWELAAINGAGRTRFKRFSMRASRASTLSM
jgi:hypothetical protein